MELSDKEINRQAAELFSRTFEEISAEDFYYKHFKNPERLEEPVSYRVADEKICAMNAFDQVTMLVCGKEMRAIQSSDSAVDKECRGQGLFWKIQTETLAQYAENEGDMAFGIPNDKSFPIFMKLNWSDVGELYGYRRMVNPVGCIASLLGREKNKTFGVCEQSRWREYEVTIGTAPSIITDEDIAVINQDTVVGVKRSVEYYNWRVFQKSGTDYVIIKIASQAKLLGLFIIVRKKATHFVFGDIVEWYIRDGIEEEHIENIAKKLRKSLIGWCDFSTIGFVNPVSGESDVVNKLGYRKSGARGYRLISKELSKRAQGQTVKLENWKFRGIDPDTMMNS